MRVSAHPDSGIHIRRELGAAKKEGVGFSAVMQDDAGDHSPFDDEIEACCLEFFLDIEDLVKDTGLIGIGLLKTEGQDLHPGFFDIRRKPGRRAVNPDTDFLPDDDLGRISKAIRNSLTDVFDDAFKLDKLTVTTEVGAALVPGVGREKGAIGSKNLIGEETKAFSDFHQDMKNVVIEFFT